MKPRWLRFESHIVMPKRKLDADAPLKEQFQALRQVASLNHRQCRSVMELVNVDKVDTGKRSCSRKEQLYPDAARALRNVTVCGENTELTLLLFSVVERTQNKLNSCPFFHDCLAEVVQAHNYELELLVFWDEIVPGNVLAPDLRRKAAATYFAYADVAALWADTSWMTLSLTRSQELQGMPQGYAQQVRHFGGGVGGNKSRVHARVSNGPLSGAYSQNFFAGRCGRTAFAVRSERC